MLVTFACAYGERTKCRKPIPCRLRSSKKTPSPWTRRLSSLRGMLWPAQPRFVSVSSTTSARSSVVSVISGRLFDRLDDVHVPGTAADVPLDCLPNLVLAGARVGVEQVFRGHQHARRAVAALQRVGLTERLLERMQLAVAGETLNRLDRRPVGLDRKHHAALDGVAVVEDGTRAAVARVAADVCPGQIEVVADEVDEQPPRRDLALVQVAVDVDLDRLVFHPLLLAWSTARSASTSARCRRYSPEPWTS